MYSAVLTFHIVVCLTMIVVVLVQSGKGSDIGAAFGGGSSQTLFGSSGPQSFLGKVTSGLAVIFMVTSLVLATMSSHQKGSSVVLDNAKTQAATPVKADSVPAPEKK